MHSGMCQTPFLSTTNKLSVLIEETDTVLPDGYTAYSVKYMKKHLTQHFGESNIRFLKNTGIAVLSNLQDLNVKQFHSGKRSRDPDQERLRIIQTVSTTPGEYENEVGSNLW